MVAVEAAAPEIGSVTNGASTGVDALVASQAEAQACSLSSLGVP